MAIDRPFTNLEGEQKNIRTVTHEGAVWFVAPDVCRALGLTMQSGATQHLSSLDSDQKKTLAISEGLWSKPEYRYLFKTAQGRGSQVSLIEESGLYKVILRAQKVTARPFQDWVTKVVLPTIRKEGVYIRGEEKIAKVSTLSELEDLQEQMLNLAGRKAQILEGLLKKAEDRIAELEPQAEAYSFVLIAESGLYHLLMRLRQTGAALFGRHGTPNGPP
ncbi:BRO family protein [Gluconobacter albidus]|uniref:BRO-N domain-containing protein n=1 Tax=Gluconobacter albidus TaxID=318683 RepID=UPI0020A140A3|nr:BRO family protein [Gluconobacter albidus]MCP1272280.1 BRO family protein [Gluconobacter albidus]